MLIVGGAVVSWLVQSFPDQEVQVWTMARDIMLHFYARHFTLSTQVYKWVPVNLMLAVTLRWTSIPSRGEKKYCYSLHATEFGTSSSLISHLACMQTYNNLLLPI